MNDVLVESEMSRLLEAGRREAPSQALLGRTLLEVAAEAGRPGVQTGRPWRSLWRAKRQMGMAALACAALTVLWLATRSGQDPRALLAVHAERTKRISPERLAPIPAPTQTSSNVRPVERPAPAPAPVSRTPNSPEAEPLPVLRKPVLSAAELAARQQEKSGRQQFEAAAARALARRQRDAQCVPQACSVVRPSDSLIADFSDVSDEGVFVDSDAFSRKSSDWWQRFYGSTYVYPEVTGSGGLQQTYRGRWHVRGTVHDWAGFGLWLGACTVDLSQYRGLSFDLWGQTGPSSAVTLYVDTQEDSPPEACRSNVGGCAPDRGPCVSPSKRIRVPDTRGEPIVILWEELRGGAPRATPDPEAIIQWHWSFDWIDSGETQPYAVDVWVDNVRLVP